MAWMTTEGFVYYGAQNLATDTEIPDAPGQFYNWNGTKWILNEADEALHLREAAKTARAKAVAAITVTVSTGKVFDGDESSQTRMSRAIVGMQAANVPTIQWTLADNSVVDVTLAEITEALILAGQRQAELWPI